MNTRRTSFCMACIVATSVAPALAQAPAGLVPMRTGTAIVQTLSTATVERESVHLVTAAADSGLHFEWRSEEVYDNGDTQSAVFRYFEARADVDTAGRLRFFHDPNAPEAHPGYTMRALSRAIYREVRAGRTDSMQVMDLDIPPGSSLMQAFGMGGGRSKPIRWRGTIAPVSPGTVRFPVLINGRRVQLAALHLRGDFTARQGRWQPELWVLADSIYPLILKWVGAHRETANVLQTTRIDLPAKGGGTKGSLPAGGALEGELIASCRVELPGIYFAFNSAHLAPESDRAIAEIAGILARHPGWTATLEGHTDSIGSAAANQALSERRVTAVRARLVGQYKVDVARLRVAGYGAARPREANTTIEGRARNRRVELVRDCASGKEP
jgi:outer membrane protein OmpA-like peptidoglycan-associated protein